MRHFEFGSRCYDPGSLALIGAVATGFSAGSSIFGGINANKAAKQEADLQAEQGRIAMQEAQTNATNEAYNQTQFVQKQRLAFLANGVTLEGSPSEVLKSSKNYGQQQVNAILSEGAAKYNLAQREAAITKNKGRAALLSGIAGGVSDVNKGVQSGYFSGMFDPNKKAT